jgi:hypothetical protein
MKKIVKIKNAEVQRLVSDQVSEYPKYTTQLMNLANQNAGGTRPSIVGQMSDLIQECPGRNLKDWEAWYKERHPDAIQRATEKVWSMLEAMKAAGNQIDKAMVQQWIEDLVIVKTYAGLRVQEAILRKVSEDLGTTYRASEPAEEAKGIDGYVGDVPVSIKPTTYKTMKGLPERISVGMIYYEKDKDGITIDYSAM